MKQKSLIHIFMLEFESASELLIKNGANANVVNNDYETALTYASGMGNSVLQLSNEISQIIYFIQGSTVLLNYW